MSAGDMWEVPVGVDDAYQVTIYGANNQPIAYTGSETLAVQCWQGDDLEGVDDLVTATWTGGTPGSGTCVLNISGTTSATLAAESVYLLRLLITSGGKTYDAWEGWLRLTDSPGTGTAPATYCTLQDMLDHGGSWVLSHMSEMGRTSFLADRARARVELDKVILAKIRPGQLTTEYWQRAGYAEWRPEQPNQYLKGLLDNDQLIVSQDVKSATAYLALALLCERSLTWADNDPFEKRRLYFRAKWQQQVSTMVAEIDTSDPLDGVGDIAINLGYHSFR